MNRRKIVFLALVCAWMIVIFIFSHKNADESTKTSHEVGKIIGEIVVPHFSEKPEEVQMQWAVDIDFYVRKSAHALEYAVLSMLFLGYLFDGVADRKNLKKILLSISFSALYACTDEIHQLFVEGRAGRFTDVLIDTLGASVGVLIVCLFLQLYIAFLGKKKRTI